MLNLARFLLAELPQRSPLAGDVEIHGHALVVDHFCEEARKERTQQGERRPHTWSWCGCMYVNFAKAAQQLWHGSPYTDGLAHAVWGTLQLARSPLSVQKQLTIWQEHGAMYLSACMCSALCAPHLALSVM